MTATVNVFEIKLTLLAAGVKYENLIDAIVWSFGSLKVDLKNWAKEWNSLHPDLFQLDGKSKVFDATYLAGEAYAIEHYDTHGE